MNWEQLKAVLGLRWRLTRNRWARSKSGLGAAFAAIMVVAICLLATASFGGGFFGAAFGLRNARSDAVMLTWFGVTGWFLFIWLIGLLAELQRSEAIDLQRLMHLPVKLGQIFFINYLASHLALSIVIVLPGMIGLTLGLASTRGPHMLLMLPLALSMILMITAWTYYLRGWLAALMINPRRRRSVIAGATLAIVLIAQLPNIYVNVFARTSGRRHSSLPFGKMLAVQKFVPPFWVSLGARALADGNPAPALLGTLGCVSIGAIGLRRAYQGTLKFYQGGSTGKSTVPVRSELRPASECDGRRKNRLVERTLPFVSEEASAVAFASFRCMLRAPEIKMAWVMSFVVTIFIGASIVLRSHTHIPESAKSFLIPGLIAFSLLTLAQFLSNQFGFDRDGFQTFVLSPAQRRAIVLGKNLAAVPVITFSSLIWLILVCVFVHLPALTAVAGLFQIASMSLLAAIAGNFISIYLPFRVRAASLKPTKISGARGVFLVLCQLMFPLLMIPVILGPAAEILCRISGIARAWPINLLYSAFLAALAFVLYRSLLPSFGARLQKRETKILEVLTTEIE